MSTNYYYVNFLSISLKKKGGLNFCGRRTIVQRFWFPATIGPLSKRLLEYECTYYIKVISSDYIHAVVCRLLVENSEMI